MYILKIISHTMYAFTCLITLLILEICLIQKQIPSSHLCEPRSMDCQRPEKIEFQRYYFDLSLIISRLTLILHSFLPIVSFTPTPQVFHSQHTCMYKCTNPFIQGLFCVLCKSVLHILVLHSFKCCCYGIITQSCFFGGLENIE